MLRTVFTHRRQIGLWSAALLTALMGVINLLSTDAPTLPERVVWLRSVVSFEVQAGGRIFSAVSGFFLLTLAANLLHRKRLAWSIVTGLLLISIIGHLIKGVDFEESIVAIILLVQLVLMRTWFTAQSDRPSIAQGIRTLVIALLFTLVYGTLGFFWRERQYVQTFDIGKALVQTLAMFFTADNAGLEPVTPAGRYFAHSIYIVGAVSMAYSLWMLLRPVLFWEAASEEERAKAHGIRQRREKFTHFSQQIYKTRNSSSFLHTSHCR